MKAILVPTDFSDCAVAAEDAAMQVAKIFGGEVHLYHNYKTAKKESLTEEERKVISEGILQKLTEEAKALEGSYPEVPVKIHYSFGKLVEGIEKQIETLAIDFLVIGSHGASGKTEYFIGSNAQKIVRMIHLPVLVVKEKIEELKFKKVVFASNFNTSEKEPFRQFLKFIEPFSPQIYLVNVDKPSIFDTPYIVQRDAMEDFREIAAPLVCEIKMLRHLSVDAGIRYFSDEINADLLVISNHNRHPIKRIMAGSNVEALVNHAEIPVLTIDFPASKA